MKVAPLSSFTVAESGLATGASATFVTVTLTVAEAMFPCASTIVYVKLSGRSSSTPACRSRRWR
jgi:hypothetical protein